LVVALLIVIFLVLPATLIVAWALTRSSTSEESHHGSFGLHQKGIDLTSSGSNPVDSPDSSNASQSGNNGGSAAYDPSLSGPKAFDFDAGFMTFLFTPELQTAIDDNTNSMLGELLTSPQYTEGSNISVEIPLLSDDDMAKITSAVTNAFNTYNVPLSDVVFFVYQPESGAQTFEISISLS